MLSVGIKATVALRDSSGAALIYHGRGTRPILGNYVPCVTKVFKNGGKIA